MSVSSARDPSSSLHRVARARRWLAEVEREARGEASATWPTLDTLDRERLASAADRWKGRARPDAPGPETPWKVRADAADEAPTWRPGPPGTCALLAPGTQLGSWEVLSELGRGAYGSVYAARHRVLGRRVAIKVLNARASRDPDYPTRLEREARASNQVGHEAVVGVFDLGDDAGRPYLVMEHIPGRTLLKELEHRGPLAVHYALGLLRPIAEAVDEAHRVGVLHRDLKPENVLLEPTSHGSRARLIDFGVASLPGDAEGSGAARSLVGTPRYMAPELVEGQPASPSTDLYGFGIMLYELLVGRAPFSAKTPLDILWQHVSKLPPLPSEASSRLPRCIDAGIMAMLAKDPAERPSSLVSALERIERDLERAVVPAVPPLRLD